MSLPQSFVIKVMYGGLGDILFQSHLPRIAKKLGCSKVYISRFSETRRPEYTTYIWFMNPYVDGVTEEDSSCPGQFEVPESMNILDKLMLERGLDDGERWHEPEIYFKPDVDESLKDEVVFDPNYISNAGDVSLERLQPFLNRIGVTAVMPRQNKGFDVACAKVVPTDGSFKRYCEVIVSCKRFVCLVSGGATLAAALGTSATVVHKGIHRMFLHSKRHEYVSLD